MTKNFKTLEYVPLITKDLLNWQIEHRMALESRRFHSLSCGTVDTHFSECSSLYYELSLFYTTDAGTRKSSIVLNLLAFAWRPSSDKTKLK